MMGVADVAGVGAGRPGGEAVVLGPGGTVIEGSGGGVALGAEPWFVARLAAVTVPRSGAPVGAHAPEASVVLGPASLVAAFAGIIAVAGAAFFAVLFKYPPAGFLAVAHLP